MNFFYSKEIYLRTANNKKYIFLKIVCHNLNVVMDFNIDKCYRTITIK